MRQGLTSPRRCCPEGDVPVAVRERRGARLVEHLCTSRPPWRQRAGRHLMVHPRAQQCPEVAVLPGLPSELPPGLPSLHPGPAHTSGSPPTWMLLLQVPPASQTVHS